MLNWPWIYSLKVYFGWRSYFGVNLEFYTHYIYQHNDILSQNFWRLVSDGIINDLYCIRIRHSSNWSFTMAVYEYGSLFTYLSGFSGHTLSGFSGQTWVQWIKNGAMNPFSNTNSEVWEVTVMLVTEFRYWWHLWDVGAQVGQPNAYVKR